MLLSLSLLSQLKQSFGNLNTATGAAYSYLYRRVVDSYIHWTTEKRPSGGHGPYALTNATFRDMHAKTNAAIANKVIYAASVYKAAKSSLTLAATDSQMLRTTGHMDAERERSVGVRLQGEAVVTQGGSASSQPAPPSRPRLLPVPVIPLSKAQLQAGNASQKAVREEIRDPHVANSEATNRATMPVTSGYSAPRQPIVLCHGLFGFDKIGPESIPRLQIHYWSGIQDALTRLGAKVIVTKVPRTGGIEERAKELDRILSVTIGEDNSRGNGINLLAHSMGGLDCRYLISHIRPTKYDVKSLTTISTPHRGSPMMDWFRDHIGVGVAATLAEATLKTGIEAAKAGKRVVDEVRAEPITASEEIDPQRGERIRRIFREGEKEMSEQHARNVEAEKRKSESKGGTSSTSGAKITLPFLGEQKISLPNIDAQKDILNPLLNRLIQTLDTPAYSNLTTDYLAKHFNPNTPDDPKVRYFSYGASMKKISIWTSPLGFPWEVIREKEGENDGLVSIMSAKWGKYIETVEADHWDLNGRWRIKWPGQKYFDVEDFYAKVATRLWHDGF